MAQKVANHNRCEQNRLCATGLYSGKRLDRQLEQKRNGIWI